MPLLACQELPTLQRGQMTQMARMPPFINLTASLVDLEGVQRKTEPSREAWCLAPDAWLALRGLLLLFGWDPDG